jgi:hypothetical protein
METEGDRKVMSLECCVCGNSAGNWRQHWNRDTGYGVCPDCIKWLRERGTTEEEIKDLYGTEGVNFAPPTIAAAAAATMKAR